MTELDVFFSYPFLLPVVALFCPQAVTDSIMTLTEKVSFISLMVPSPSSSSLKSLLFLMLPKTLTL
jgi:hypothetical protein